MSKLEKLLDDTYDSIKETFDKAEDSTIPYPVVTENDDIKIVGDPNNIKHIKKDYNMTFIIPKDLVPNNEGEIVGDKKVIRKTFTDVEVVASKNMALCVCICTLIPYFYKPNEDGNVEDYSKTDKSRIRKAFLDEDFTQTLRDFSSIVLDLDDDLAQYLSVLSMIRLFESVGKDYPEIMNESFSFFV